ncbi:unnamed protein product [Cunninghamella blakesleeana]
MCDYEGKYPEQGEVIYYGDFIELRHVQTERFISVDDARYENEGGSGQVRVVGSDTPTRWVVLPIGDSEERIGNEVGYDDQVVLQDTQSGERLHCSPDITSPVTGQREVSVYGGHDDNDNWTVKQADDGNEDGFWRAGENFFLIHCESNYYLHTHNFPVEEDSNLNEATCYHEGDENSVFRI